MSSNRSVFEKDAVFVVDLVSDDDDDDDNDLEQEDGAGASPADGHDDSKETQKPSAGKRKLDLQLVEPNRKNPFPRTEDADTWSADTAAASAARRVSPSVDLHDNLHCHDDNDDAIGVASAAATAAAAADLVKPPPLIWMKDDDCLVTYGVVFPPLQQQQLQVQPGQCQSTTTKNFLMTNSKLVQHIQQTDQWSCGFRNIQMLLSALVPLLPSSHPFFEALAHIYTEIPSDLVESILVNNNNNNNHADLLILPSLTQLQKQLETSWNQGFDPEGAEHFKHSVVGRRSKIGAVEVGFLFAFWRVDAHVVQFLKCVESRRLLPAFCFSYFSTLVQPDQSTVSLVQTCLAWAEQHCDSTQTAAALLADANLCHSENAGTTTILPLYLQWEGHSVTIIGIEPPQGNAATLRINDWNQWNLLILCPGKSGVKFKTGGMAPFRMSCRTLGRMDCQLLVAGWNPLTLEARSARQTKAASTTAAEEAVVRAMQRAL